MQTDTYPRFAVVIWFVDGDEARWAFDAEDDWEFETVEEFDRNDLKRAIARADELHRQYQFKYSDFSVELCLRSGCYSNVYFPRFAKPERGLGDIQAYAERVIRDYEGFSLQ